MPSHRRGRSLSEALTLEQLDEGGVVISSINNGASSDQGLKEGDEILGATINFDQLSKEEVLEVLKLMEPFDDKIQVLTRNNLSKSLGNLDQYARDPETMLKDSYSKLYNAKVKRFMRGEEPNAEEGYVNGEVTGKPTIPGSSKVNLKHDTGLPRFGVDFGLLKSKTLSTDTDADSQFGAGELTDGRNLNLPPFGLGLNGTSLNKAQGSGLELDARSPQLKTPDFILSGRLPEDPNVSATAGMQLPNTDSPSVDLAMANLERPQIGLESNRTYKAPEIATNLKGLDVTTPKMGLNLDGGNITGPSLNTGVPQVSIEGTNHDFKMPKYKMPDLGLSGPHAQYSKRLKNPDLNVDDPSSYLESPNLVGVKTPDLSLKNPKVKGGISTPDINLPKASPQGPNLAADTPSVSIEGPSGKYKAPKFAMPKFDLPDIKVPSFNGELEGPNFKGAMAHPNVDVNVPSTDMNIKSPSGKLKIPGFGLSGSKVERPGYQLETPEMDVSALKGKGGINFPGVDLTDAKLNPNMPDVNMASSKFDIDANASSGKLKLPKFKLFGTLSKKKDVDVNAGITGPNLDLKSSDLDISGPNLSGGIKAPDINMPKIDLKAPKLDLNTQNVDLDMSSGKLKMPDVHAPDWDVSPRLGKVKMPKVNLSGTLPKGPNMDLNTDVNPPDWSLKAPKMKGGVNAPDFDLPNMDIKAPKLDVNTPNVNIGSPKAKLKFPKIKSPKLSFPNFQGSEIDGDIDGPGIDVNAPNVNLKGPNADVDMPDIEMPGLSGKLKKPNLNMPDFGLSGVNSDVNLPDWSLKAPKVKGGINAPDFDLPNMDIKAPKLDVKMPKPKMPKVNLPGLKGPEIDGGIDGPDVDIGASSINVKGSKTGFEMPDVDFGGLSEKFKAPHLKLPDVGFSASKLDGPNVNLNSSDFNAKLPKSPNLKLHSDLKTPELHTKVPKMKGGFDSPKLGLPNMDLKASKLDMNPPDANIGFPDVNFKKPKMKMPKGPNVDINTDLQGPELSIPNLDINGPKGNLKMPDLNAPHLSLSGPKAKTPDMNLSGPKLKGPGISMPDLDLPNASFKGPKLDLNAKRPDLGINGGSDIDFGASLRPTNLDISPPNAKLNVKPAELKGNVTGPNVSAPNMDINMPKAAMRNPQLHLKYPNLDVDDPSLNFKGPSYKNRRSDMTGVNMKMPDLDVDADVRLRHTDGRSPRTQVRSSYPGLNDASGHHIDFHRSDLNIDDFTGKDHVLRARGSKLNLQAPHSYGQVISSSGGSIDMRDPRNARRIPANLVNPNASLPHFSQSSSIRVPNSSDGYYVTVFPNQTQNQRMPNRKYNTLGGLDFHPGNLDLEVPDGNDLKGSTFFFSNLV